VVWPEAATMVYPQTEQHFKSQLGELARELGVNLVVSYVVLLSENPFKYENKLLWYLPSGSLDHQYLKHEPVPGEPAVKGTEPHRLVNVEGIKMSGAICYDYDFPALAAKKGDLGADIVAVPSSDWLGITPFHTEMAGLRAIEQGHSIIRSTRWGQSSTMDPYGNTTSTMNDFDKNSKVMFGHLPKAGVKTIFNRFGNWFIYLQLIFVIAGWVWFRKKSNLVSVLGLQ